MKWVKMKLDDTTLINEKIVPGKTVLVIDTTYFGREFGAMVFRCAERKKIFCGKLFRMKLMRNISPECVNWNRKGGAFPE